MSDLVDTIKQLNARLSDVAEDMLEVDSSMSARFLRLEKRISDIENEFNYKQKQDLIKELEEIKKQDSVKDFKALISDHEIPEIDYADGYPFARYWLDSRKFFLALKDIEMTDEFRREIVDALNRNCEVR